MAKKTFPTKVATAAPTRPTLQLHLADPHSTPLEKVEGADGEMMFSLKDELLQSGKQRGAKLVKSILNALETPEDSIERLAFEMDPATNSTYYNVYRPKIRGIPDTVLKRIAVQDDLVAAIINARSNFLSHFGRPQPDRFGYGFKFESDDKKLREMDEATRARVHSKIVKTQKLLLTCGHDEGWEPEERSSFAEFLSLQARNALVLGRFATEVIWRDDPSATDTEDRKTFYAFRAIDAGTIYRASRHKSAAEKVREEARHLLQLVADRKLPKEENPPPAEEYAWIQVIEGTPRQAFTAKECVVHNCYPVTDYEWQGYPITPLDTVIAAVTTHINITTHNKLFFQSGRATRGMLVIKSPDIGEQEIGKIRQQFMAQINNVNNSWRMPVFSISPEDEVTWTAIDTGSRDAEFQYLSDTNARVILSAFQMSPEELPGYAHLSRGTNNQALSESNNEYKLEAHRDVGIRPLLCHFEDFLNQWIVPLLDPEVAKYTRLRLVGLDASTPEKETAEIQGWGPVHGTYDEILQKVDKAALGAAFGGAVPLNPQLQTVWDKYLTVGQILEKFFGVPNASKNPDLTYMRDPFWFQMQNLKLQVAMAQQQSAEQQGSAAAAGPGGGAGGGGGGEGPGQGSDAPQQNQDGAQAQDNQSRDGQKQAETNEQQDASGGGQDLTRALDQALELLNKSEAQLPASRKRLVAKHRATVKHLMDEWHRESKHALAEILDVAEKHAPVR